MGSMTEPTRRARYAKAPMWTQTDTCGGSIPPHKAIRSDDGVDLR